MNIESTFTVLRREQLLIEHSPHSVQFENLTERLLRVFSAAAVIPPLTAEETCGVFHPLLLACFAQHIGAISRAVYP